MDLINLVLIVIFMIVTVAWMKLNSNSISRINENHEYDVNLIKGDIEIADRKAGKALDMLKEKYFTYPVDNNERKSVRIRKKDNPRIVNTVSLNGTVETKIEYSDTRYQSHGYGIEAECSDIVFRYATDLTITDDYIEFKYGYLEKSTEVLG